MFEKLKHNLKTLKTIIQGTLIICPYCGSMEVLHDKPEVTYETDKDTKFRKETYVVVCNKCNKAGVIREMWVDDIKL